MAGNCGNDGHLNDPPSVPAPLPRVETRMEAPVEILVERLPKLPMFTTTDVATTDDSVVGSVVECIRGLTPDLSSALLDMLQKTVRRRRGRPPGTKDSKPRCKKIDINEGIPPRSNQRGRPLGSRDVAPRRKPGAISCIKVRPSPTVSKFPGLELSVSRLLVGGARTENPSATRIRARGGNGSNVILDGPPQLLRQVSRLMIRVIGA